MLRFLARRYVKAAYVFRQETEATMNELNAKFALRTADKSASSRRSLLIEEFSLCNDGYPVTAVILFGPEVGVGILIKMPAPRFERLSFKTHRGAIILTKCTQCGKSRVGSLADGSLHTWEKNHRCGSLRVAEVTEKEIG